MSDDDKALVAELRKRRVYKDGVRRQPRKHEREAADRIEALEAENERLREALRGVTPPAHFGESEQSKAWWAKARAALGEKQ